MLKYIYNVFYGIDLESYFKELGKMEVIVIGVMINCCCEIIVWDVFVRGFCVFFLIDVIVISNEDLYNSSLKILVFGFVYFVNVNSFSVILK